MNLQKILTRFTHAPEDRGELRRVARALGNELPRQRLKILRSFRAQMARVSMRGKSYAAGYVSGMLDVTAEYESTVQQGEEDGALRRVALREGWRDILMALETGPRLPSELARRLGRDRSTITRILRQLRAAGLVRASSDALDGRARPHRLTAQGRRMLTGSNTAISNDVERGIAIAVHLFQYLLDHDTTPASALDTIAEEVLGNNDAARAAVSKWAAESQKAGMVAAERDLASGSERYHISSQGNPALAVRSSLLWRSIPSVLNQRKQYRREVIPVYVRTGGEGWAAWAHALHTDETCRASRTIVNGDLVSRAIEPPTERFDLLYDDPAAIHSDRDEPTMQAFMAQADAKFVIAATEVEIPEGFIPLKLKPDSEAQ